MRMECSQRCSVFEFDARQFAKWSLQWAFVAAAQHEGCSNLNQWAHVVIESVSIRNRALVTPTQFRLHLYSDLVHVLRRLD
jgi:hypothetical protein